MILGIIGAIIGIGFFVFIIKRINFVFANFFTIMMIFTVCLSLGVLAAYILGWLILIVIVIAIIYSLIRKAKSKFKSESPVSTDEKQYEDINS